MSIAIIPARKNSKRIKNKNIKLINNKPLIYIVIKILQKSKLFKKIIVSTDSNKIAKISINAGAEVPYLRSKKLSDDYSTTDDVIYDTIIKLNSEIKSKYVCCVYPTAILLKIKDIKLGYEKIKKNNLDYVFSATKHNKSVLRSFILNKEKIVKQLIKKNYYDRSQDLADTYFDSGMFYWGKKISWIKKKNIFSSKTKIIEIPYYRCQDIDNLNDFKQAKIKFNKFKEKKHL